MGTCKLCQKNGAKPGTENYSLCEDCGTEVIPKIDHHISVIQERLKMVQKASHRHSLGPICDAIVDSAKQLLKYEETGVPTLQPLPSRLIKVYTKKKEEIVVAKVERGGIKGDYFTIGREKFRDVSWSPEESYVAGTHSGLFHHDGACALVDGISSELIYQVSVTKPNRPRVTEEGCVLVEDMTDYEMYSNLLMYSQDGRNLWTRNFKANLLNSGISDDGETAFAVTDESKHEPHHKRTFFLDARTGSIINEEERQLDEDELADRLNVHPLLMLMKGE